MSEDLISRQAAIDAADRADYTGLALAVEDVKKVTDEVIKELKRLPSAEPRWVAVDERVPEVGTYIVTGKQKYDWEYTWHYFVDVAYCPGNYIDNYWDTFNDWYEGQETHIIAWMPLPESWKGEADD